MYERRRLTGGYTMFLALLVSLFAMGEAFAFFGPNKGQPEEEIGGAIKATINGKAFYFPSLKSDVKARIEGDLAMVTIEQTFINPASLPLNASYLFPLNKDAAVHFMQMEVGDERITAVIKKKEEARAAFEVAKRQGKSAALLVQHRPNMFTQELANLVPGKPIKVTLTYAMAVPRIDGAYELVVPLVVGPRYTPPKTSVVQTVSNGEKTQAIQPQDKNGEWSFSAPPAYPQVSGLSIPDTIEKDRVSIQVDLTSSFAIQEVKSATHLLKLDGGDRQKTASLAAGRTVDNKDFVLRYKLSSQKIGVGLLAHRDQRGDFFSLLLEPPRKVEGKDVTPREMVFVLDTSGSMSGQPMEASKVFMRHAIGALRPDDYFRIIRFSTDTGEFSSRPVKATLLNKMAGIKYVNSLQAAGGTQIPAAMERAFATRPQPGTLRIVTFLSDGYIGNEARVLGLISKNIGDARIYAFGVGSAVNRYLLSEMGRVGRGFARFIDPTENVNEVAIELAKRLEAPLLTHIKVDWGTLQATDMTPHRIPDLFKGDSLRLMARATGKLAPGSTHKVIVKGRVNGRIATMPLTLTVPQNLADERMSALPVIWARTRIADHMRSIVTPSQWRLNSLSNAKLQELVTSLGLDFSLMTRWTSFVAVSEKIINQTPASSVNTSVPLNQVKGVLDKAYGKKLRTRPVKSPMQKAQIITQPGQSFNVAVNSTGGTMSSFGGSSTPEPGTNIAMLVLLLMLLAGLRWSYNRTV